MSKRSAGILLYRMRNKFLEVFLVHPGGPFWAKKDAGAWSIPKGEFSDDEEPLAAAIREFKEETGIAIKGKFIELNAVRQKSGKYVYAWAAAMDIDATTIRSNQFEMEWPPKSGKMKLFREIDRADWFAMNQAKEKVNPGQLPLLAQLETMFSTKK